MAPAFAPDYASAGLNPEQLALLDFLVLTEADRAVGFGSSTFSFYLREYRLLRGVPSERTRLLRTPRIGTDALFAAAAGVAAAGVGDRRTTY